MTSERERSPYQLQRGDRLGPYEVVDALGAGGMGEVYRARDTQLKRDVAIKVLPEAFAQDPERLARFQREAEPDGQRFLVQTLADSPTAPFIVTTNWATGSQK